MPSNKTYMIHDNGARPFTVIKKGFTVSIYNNRDYENPPIHMMTVDADKVFIGGKSPTGEYDGTAHESIGNSILLKIDNKYMYIGSEIYEFSPIKGDTIVKFYSDILGSDVPYPYAIGKTHIYIMLDKVAIEKSFFDMSVNIYEQHYYQHHIRTCLARKPKSKICKNKSEYMPRIKEWADKMTKLRTKDLTNKKSKSRTKDMTNKKSKSRK